MVMHSISDHTLNIPSQGQVDRYLKSLEKTDIQETGTTCTEPSVVTKGRSRVTGISFGRNALLFMSLSPYGMEDLPSSIKAEIDVHARRAGLMRAMLVDCHNAMGPEISGDDYSDMLQASRECLDALAAAKQHPMEIGYANSNGMDVRSEDMGMGGLGMLCLGVNGSRYYMGWGRRQQHAERHAGEGGRRVHQDRPHPPGHMHLGYALYPREGQEPQRLLSAGADVRRQ